MSVHDYNICEHSKTIVLPKKKDPLLRALSQKIENKQFFDSADYELMKLSTKSKQGLQVLRENAIHAPHYKMFQK